MSSPSVWPSVRVTAAACQRPVTPRQAKPAMRRVAGFTLIEVLIAVVIVGIIAAIAVPNYSSYMQKTRRTDAIGFLAEAAGEQYRYFSENNRYAADMKTLGYGTAATFPTPEGLYSVAISRPTETSYTMTATPVAGKTQANDTTCGAFSITHTGRQTVSTTTDPRDCW